MPTFKCTTQHKVERWYIRILLPTFKAIPPNFFAIPMGIVEFASMWRWAAVLYALPIAISDGIYLLGTLVYIVLVVALDRCEFSARLFNRLCCRCSTPGRISRFAAP